MGWAFFYMFVILKIPVLMALWLVWWSVKQEPQPDEGGGDGGNDRAAPGHPRPRRPRPPRRGPHAGPGPAAPKRVRARARRLDVAHR